MTALLIALGIALAGLWVTWWVRAFVDGLGRHWRNEDDAARPLVVIDPEDRQQVKALRRAVESSNHTFVEKWQDALRSLITPPPKVVFEHLALDGSSDPRTSLCGKVWTPDENVTVLGRCTTCAAIVESGWTP